MSHAQPTANNAPQGANQNNPLSPETHIKINDEVDYAPKEKLLSFEDNKRKFIRKVYTMVLIQFTLVCGAAVATQITAFQLIFDTHWYIPLIALVIIFAISSWQHLHNPDAFRKAPFCHIIYFILTISVATAFAGLTAWCDDKTCVILTALMMFAVSFSAWSYGMAYTNDFDWKVGMLNVLVMVLAIGGFFGLTYTGNQYDICIFVCFGLFFGGLLLIQISRSLDHYTIDDTYWAAINVFSDLVGYTFIALFMCLISGGAQWQRKGGFRKTIVPH